MMNAARTLIAFAALGLLRSAAHGALISYSTEGFFNGTPDEYTETVDGIGVGFDGVLGGTITAPPTSIAGFGIFDTSSTSTTTNEPVNSPFTLEIFQTTPSVGTGEFVGTLQGTLSVDNSQAYVQFAAPFSTTIGNVVYTITSSDGGVPGRVNIEPTNGDFGFSTVEGTIAYVPEPASMGLVAVASLSMIRRRRSEV